MTASGQLTKSLHTVTAVVRVAMHLNERALTDTDIEELVSAALRVLGHTGWTKYDPTVAKCIAALKKELGQ